MTFFQTCDDFELKEFSLISQLLGSLLAVIFSRSSEQSITRALNRVMFCSEPTNLFETACEILIDSAAMNCGLAAIYATERSLDGKWILRRLASKVKARRAFALPNQLSQSNDGNEIAFSHLDSGLASTLSSTILMEDFQTLLGYNATSWKSCSEYYYLSQQGVMLQNIGEDKPIALMFVVPDKRFRFTDSQVKFLNALCERILPMRYSSISAEKQMRAFNLLNTQAVKLTDSDQIDVPQVLEKCHDILKQSHGIQRYALILAEYVHGGLSCIRYSGSCNMDALGGPKSYQFYDRLSRHEVGIRGRVNAHIEYGRDELNQIIEGRLSDILPDPSAVYFMYHKYLYGKDGYFAIACTDNTALDRDLFKSVSNLCEKVIIKKQIEHSRTLMRGLRHDLLSNLKKLHIMDCDSAVRDRLEEIASCHSSTNTAPTNHIEAQLSICEVSEYVSSIFELAERSGSWCISPKISCSHPEGCAEIELCTKLCTTALFNAMKNACASESIAFRSIHQSTVYRISAEIIIDNAKPWLLVEIENEATEEGILQLGKAIEAAKGGSVIEAPSDREGLRIIESCCRRYIFKDQRQAEWNCVASRNMEVLSVVTVLKFPIRFPV